MDRKEELRAIVKQGQKMAGDAHRELTGLLEDDYLRFKNSCVGKCFRMGNHFIKVLAHSDKPADYDYDHDDADWLVVVDTYIQDGRIVVGQGRAHCRPLSQGWEEVSATEFEKTFLARIESIKTSVSSI